MLAHFPTLTSTSRSPGVGGEDVVAESHHAGDEVGACDVAGVRAGEEATDGPAVVEWMDGDGVEERRQTGLACAVPPDLRHDGVGGVQRRPGANRCGEQDVRVPIAAVDRDEEPGIEDHRR